MPASAEWFASQRISDKIFADLTAMAAVDGPRRLYGLSRSGIKTPAINANPAGGLIIGLNISGRSSELYQVSYASGDWQTKAAGFPSVLSSDDGSRIADVDCNGPMLTLQYAQGGLATLRLGDELHEKHKMWSLLAVESQPTAQSFWPRSHFWIPETSTLIDGRSEFGTRMCDCKCLRNAAVPRMIPVLDGHQPVVMAYADLRGEGKKGYYAFGVGGAVLELAESNGTWSIRSVIDSAVKLDQVAAMVAGDGRGDGKQRLYVAHQLSLLEYEWRGGSFRKNVIQAPRGSGGFSGATTGLLTGKFRPDGRAAVYIANETNLIEFSFADGNWIKSVNPLGIGRIGGIKAADFQDWRNQLVAFGDAGGLHLVEWREKPVVAVLPFYSRGLDASEGRAFADIHATKIVALGECRVVERERVNSIVRELRIQGSRLVDRKTALKAASLLKADYIVTGSVGMLFDERLAALSVLSVKDGSIASTEFAQWRKDSELDANIRQLAMKACPR